MYWWIFLIHENFSNAIYGMNKLKSSLVRFLMMHLGDYNEIKQDPNFNEVGIKIMIDRVITFCEKK